MKQHLTINKSIALHSQRRFLFTSSSMASSIALKRASANLFRSVRPLSARLFNTNASLRSYDERDDRDMEDDRRYGAVTRRGGPAPSLFSDVFDPFNTTRSLSQVLNMMDQVMENPFLSASRGIGSTGFRRGWDAKEDENGLYLRVDMPGLGKENVKVSVEENTLTIRGEGEKESEDEESVRRYSSRIDLPPKLYKLDQIKAEIKNGVLKVVVPKAKEEDRKDVFHVTVE